MVKFSQKNFMIVHFWNTEEREEEISTTGNCKAFCVYANAKKTQEDNQINKGLLCSIVKFFVRPFRNPRNDYVVATRCHYARICLSGELLAQAAVTSETERPVDLKELKHTKFASSFFWIYFPYIESHDYGSRVAELWLCNKL